MDPFSEPCGKPQCKRIARRDFHWTEPKALVKFDENSRSESAAYSKFSEMHLPKMKPDLS
jgi:hypothetical protein